MNSNLILCCDGPNNGRYISREDLRTDSEYVLAEWPAVYDWQIEGEIVAFWRSSCQ